MWMVYAAWRIGSGPPPRHAAKGWRLGRGGRTEISPQVRDRLIGLAVAQRADGAADRFEGKAVAHLAVAFHVDRQEAHAVGGRPVAILAGKRVAEAILRLHRPRHFRDADRKSTRLNSSH